jgi:cobalt-zinc-cadmium efflux system protein
VAHAHSHAHPHSHAGDRHGASGPPLRTALALTAGIAVLELVGAMLSHSLALLADSAHVFMDVVALGIAVAATIASQRPANDRQSYGFARFEILAALANGVFLFAIAVLVAVAAVSRLHASEVPQGGLMAAFAGIGLLVNCGIGWSLMSGARDDLNVKAALFHVTGDAAGALAVLVGGIAIALTRAAWIDPALSLFVAGIITFGVVRIVRESSDVLLQSVPAHVALPDVRERMRAVPGVVDVHDLHIWSIGSGSYVLSAHVLLADARISDATAILRALEERLRADYAIDHVTVQFECESCGADDRIVCTQQ